MKVYLHGVILIDNEIDFEGLCLPSSPHPPVHNVLGPPPCGALGKRHSRGEHPAKIDLHVEALATLIGPSYDGVRVGVSYGMLGGRQGGGQEQGFRTNMFIYQARGV